jgi:hypothetical protein
MVSLTRSHWRGLVAIAVLATCGCEAAKSENPLSPEIAGPIPGVEITAPNLLEPGRNWKIKTTDQPITLLIENASSNGPRPLYYRFEVAADAAFKTLVFSRDNVAPGNDGRTGLRLPEALQDNRTYYWRARAADGANTGPFAVTNGFEIQPPARIFTPVPLDPTGGQTLSTRRPTFRVRNADRQGPVGRVAYKIQVSLNSTFTQVVGDATVTEGGGETHHTFGYDFDYQLIHYWRVMASDGTVSSPWREETFRTPNRPAPGPGPGPAACGTPQTHFHVVACHRAQYGTPMSAGDKVNMLRGVARELNARGFSGGPFGILRKGGGTNCNGYSCDIICSGQNSAQKQWDVLSDHEGSADPTWGGPYTVPNIRLDTCEIQ